MKHSLIFFIVFVVVLGACSVKKFIPEGEQLYTGAEIKLEADIPKKELSNLEDELENLPRPAPNSKILGVRFGLWAYYKGSQEKPGFINKFLKNKLGEEPVYFSEVQPERITDVLLNRLENRGYFYGTANYDIKESEHYASVKYNMFFGEAYHMEEYKVLADTLPIIQEIVRGLDETLIEKNTRFDLDVLKAERERIDLDLKKKGYYNFNPDFLIFEADTNQYEDRRFDLYLRLKSTTPEKSRHPYVIENIRVYPNYTFDENFQSADTVTIRGIDFVQETEVFKPDLLERYVLFEENSKYNPETSRLTANRLSSIGNFRYVNITFDETDSINRIDGSYPLDARILLSPLRKRNVRAEIQGVTKSNSFAGPALLLTYQNRNLFRGGEVLNLTGSIGYEQQLQSGSRAGLSSTEFGLQGAIIFPRVIFPVPIMNRFNVAMPKTRVSLGYEFQNRQGLYKLNSYNASFGYFWNVNRYTYHEFNPISLTLVNLSSTSPEFEEILNANPFLRRSFEQQFISGMNYTFNFNQLVDAHRKNAIFFATTIDVAGNLFRAMNVTFDTRDQGRVFGLEYAQYVKGDVDLRYYHKFTEENMFITRFHGGLGVPLGNSVSLPFVKQFFTGGPRSVRSFRIRSLGPGTFFPTGRGIGGFFDQAGDIIIEGNMEYRFPFNKFLKGAFFADVGNVWLYNENDALPGGKFSNKWFEELGVGAGFGLRIDIQLFVLRFDLAVPLRKPWLDPDDRWLETFEVGSGDWRRENLILNFAIGYPF